MMKKLLLLFLVLTGMVSTASAKYYLIGTLVNTEWSYTPVADSKAIEMTESTKTPGLYYFDYTTGNTFKMYFSVCDGDGTSWDDFNNHHRWGNANYALDDADYGVEMTQGDKTLNFTPDGTSTYRIVFDSNYNTLSFVKHINPVVAGCYTVSEVENASFFGTAWDNNSNDYVLQDNATYIKTFSNVVLKNTGTIEYKTVEKGGDLSSATKKTYDVTSAYTYNIKFQVWADNLNGAVCEVTEVAPTAYYIVGGLDGDAWTVSATPMTEDPEGTFNAEFIQPSTETTDYRFAIAPNTVIDGDAVFNWERIIRPYTGNTSDFWVYFVDYNEYTTTDDTKGNAWNIRKEFSNCYWNFYFFPGTSSWKMRPYFYLNIANNNTAEKSYATFSYPCAVKVPDGIRAFYCTATTGSTANLTKFTTGISDNEGALLAAAAGNYIFKPATDSPSKIAGNLLKPTTGANIYDSGKFQYVFAKQGGQLGFYKLTGDYSPAKGKAYLETDSELAGRLALNFDDEDATGINEVSSKQNVSGEYYNLAGQRIANPGKGLYIVNGKKVIK